METTKTLLHLLNPTGLYPSFLVPVFGTVAARFLQSLGVNGKISSFRECKTEGAELEPADGRNVSIGDDPLFAFAVAEDDIICGTSAELSVLLMEESHELDLSHFVRAETSSFLNETGGFAQANVQAAQLLAQLDPGIVDQWIRLRRLGPVLEVSKTWSPSNRIGIGVVGCGHWGPDLVRHFRTISNCTLKAICDVNLERLVHLQSLYPEVETETDFQRFLENTTLDAVAIATPVQHHYSLAKASLLAGKHTFVEKPMASSSPECEELIEIARGNGLILMVGHPYRYSSAVKKIMELVAAGDIGEIRYINCRRLNLDRFHKDINVAWDLAPHDISIILHILGEGPVSVNCSSHADVASGIADVTNMSLSFRKKRFATIQSSWLDPRIVREMTIVGTLRMIVYDDLQTVEKIRIYDTRVERPPHYDTFAEFQYSYHYGDSYIPHLDQEEPLQVLAQHFVDCVATGARPATDGEEGLQLVRVLEAANASLRANGAPVFLSTPSSVHSPWAPWGPTI